MTVCSTAGPCAVITPTFDVANTGTTGTPSTTSSVAGAPTVSHSSIAVTHGGQGSVTLSGGTTPYNVSFLSGNNVSTTLMGNTLYINGMATGTAMLNICSSSTTTNAIACTPLAVNVQAAGTTSGGSTIPTTTTTGNLSFTLPMTSGETVQLSISGGTGSYYIQPTGGVPVSTSLNGSMLTLVGTTAGQATINVCSTGTSSVSTPCLPIRIAVAPALTGTGGGFLFESNLSVGMSGSDVMELQNRLRDEGFFNVTPTGYFGPITQSAVRAYQAANGISTVGIVGPQTRARLNQ